MELTPGRARLMLIRWTIYPILMGVLAVVVIISGNDPVLAWVLLGLFALSLAFRIYLTRIIRRSGLRD